MKPLSLNVHGRTYRLQCEEGQERDLMHLADDLTQRLSELDASFGDRAETMTMENTRLVITALMLLADLRDAKQKARRRSSEDKEQVELVIADTLERIAGKLESLID